MRNNKASCSSNWLGVSSGPYIVQRISIAVMSSLVAGVKHGIPLWLIGHRSYLMVVLTMKNNLHFHH